MRRAATVLLLTASALVIVIPRSAWACSCAARSERDAARDATVVFLGVAGGGERVPGAPTALATRFRVEAVYKGVLAPGFDVTIVHEARAPACGLAFADGERYTVFAGEFHTQLIASSCSPTAAGPIPARALGLPRPDVVVPAGLDRGGGARAVAVLVWVGILVAVVLLVRRSVAAGPRDPPASAPPA